MTPDELDSAEIRRAFNHAATHYDAHAVLQREVADRLLARLDFMTLRPAQVLDIGSGTGYSLPPLRQRYPDAAISALDVAPAMLHAARARLPAPSWTQRLRDHLTPAVRPHLHYVCADMARLPFAERSMNLLWSNLALQWAEDPAATFKEFQRVLAPGGLLTFSTFGPDTLKELRTAFASIDASPHVNAFIDLHDLGDMLVNAGFASPVMEMEVLTLTYADLKSLMRDLKGLGAHNAATARRRGLLGKSAWSRLEQAYEAHRHQGRLPARFEVIYGHAWAGNRAQREDGRQVIEFNIAERQRWRGRR